MNSLKVAEVLYETKTMINKDVVIDGLNEKYHAISNHELLDEYTNDEGYVLEDELMSSLANVTSEEIKFQQTQKK